MTPPGKVVNVNKLSKLGHRQVTAKSVISMKSIRDADRRGCRAWEVRNPSHTYSGE
jgi:hypothetical protein